MQSIGKKVAFVMDIAIIVLIIIIVLVSIWQNKKYLRSFWFHELPSEKNFVVKVYAYYESKKEDSEVANLYETKVKKIVDIPVSAGCSLKDTLKSLEYNCPLNKIVCENPEILNNRLGMGIYYYNQFVKDAIEMDNKKLREYLQCFNKAKTKKQKDKCKFDYYFDEHFSSEKFDIDVGITKDEEVLIGVIYE